MTVIAEGTRGRWKASAFAHATLAQPPEGNRYFGRDNKFLKMMCHTILSKPRVWDGFRSEVTCPRCKEKLDHAEGLVRQGEVRNEPGAVT